MLPQEAHGVSAVVAEGPILQEPGTLTSMVPRDHLLFEDGLVPEAIHGGVLLKELNAPYSMLPSESFPGHEVSRAGSPLVEESSRILG